jgi:hypothetical protein
MLPAGITPRSFLGNDSISYSEAATLAGCEQKWAFSYVGEREESSKSAAMALGTEMHGAIQSWWPTGEYVVESEKAAWLMARYVEHYSADQMYGMTELLEAEKPFAVPLGEPFAGHLFGFFDGLIQVQGIVPHEGLWLHEIKTMAQWTRLKQLPVDLQVSLYIWAARQSGFPVRGVMFDAIRTQQWVRGPERPTTESFERVWVQRTDDELDAAVSQMYSALALRDQLRGDDDGARAPLKNIGQNCDWCFHVSKCFGLEVTLLDESTDSQ